MAPDKKSSRTPSQPPSWIADLTNEIQQFRRDFHLHEAEIRDLRYVVVDVRQRLRETDLSNRPRANSVSRSNSSIIPRPPGTSVQPAVAVLQQDKAV